MVIGFMHGSPIQAQSQAQAPDPLAFEVVSIKPNRSGNLRGKRFYRETYTGKSASQPVGAPAFRSLDFGVYSGQMVVSVIAPGGAKSYFIRYAVMNGTTPGPWTTIPAATTRSRSRTNHDLRVPGAGSGRARLFRLECDRHDHLHLASFLKGIRPTLKQLRTLAGFLFF